MTTEVIQHIYKFKRGSEQKVFENDPILNAGEPIVVMCDDGIVRMKIGDGIRHYNDLPFINQENDQSLKKLIEEVNLLKDEIHDAGDTVYRINSLELNNVSGNTISKRITKYLTEAYPLDRFTLGNTAIVVTPDAKYSDGTLLQTYVYDGDEWVANLNTYTVDNNCLVLERGNIAVRGFAVAPQGGVPVKLDGKLMWKPVPDLVPIQSVSAEDQFLSVSNQQINCDIRIVYNKSTEEVMLLGKNNAVVSRVPSKDFVISLDKSTEKFLTVSADGFKLSGIQSAIDASAEDTETVAKAYTDEALKKFTETYITDQEETIEMLQEIAEWIQNDETGTTQIIADVQANKSSAKRHDEKLIEQESILREHTSSLDEIKKTVEDLDNTYQTEEDVDYVISNKINELELHTIDGGRITDGNN